MDKIGGGHRPLPINNVGTITLNEPYHTSGSFAHYTHIPYTHENGEWHGNSALGYKKTKASVEGSVIRFSYVIGLGHQKNQKKEIKLTNLKAGSYTVKYQNPDGTLVDVGTIEITETN